MEKGPENQTKKTIIYARPGGVDILTITGAKRSVRHIEADIVFIEAEAGNIGLPGKKRSGKHYGNEHLER